MKRMSVGIIALLLLSVTSLYGVNTVTYKGKKVELEGEFPKVGQKAPRISVVTNDLSEIKIGKKSKKLQVVAFVTSIDTTVCSTESKKFNEKLKGMKDVNLTVVSKDLPFALKRFCKDENITNIQTASAYKLKGHRGAVKYGVNIKEPFLRDLLARAVFIINQKGKIIYREIVAEITNEPNYENILAAIQKAKL